MADELTILCDVDATFDVKGTSVNRLVFFKCADTVLRQTITISGIPVEVMARVHPEGRLSLTVTQLETVPSAPVAVEGQEAVAVTIFCPACALPHLDEGEWATRPHKTHQCQGCGHEWRPFPFATVGIAHPVAQPAPQVGDGEGGEVFRVGDRVRVHTGEEGVIHRILPDRLKRIHVLLRPDFGGMYFDFECERLPALRSSDQPKP